MDNRQCLRVGLSILLFLAGCTDNQGADHNTTHKDAGSHEDEAGSKSPEAGKGGSGGSQAADGGTSTTTRDAGKYADGGTDSPDASEPTDDPSDDLPAKTDGGKGGNGGNAGSGGSDDDDPETEVRTDGCPADAPLPLDRVRVRAAAGQAAMVVGAKIQGSNSGPTTDFTDLAQIMTAPAEGEFAQLRFSNTRKFRYLRLYAPPGSQGGIAEIEFYFGSQKLQGETFGTTSPDPSHLFALAFDGDTGSYFDITASGGGYVGIDVARGYLTQPVTFTPGTQTSTNPFDVVLQSTTTGATIHYTTDGSSPSSTSPVYSSALQMLNGRTTVRAVASADCKFDSAASSATFTVGTTAAPVGTGLKTYHLGNSLTDTINPWLKPIADSTGVTHTYARWTIPGAPIKWLKEHEGDGFGDPAGAQSFDSFVQSYAPIDAISLQPYSDPDFESQGGAAVSLLTTALQYSPNMQVYIYAQWQGQTDWKTSAFANGASSIGYTVTKPTTWEEGNKNAMSYFEMFRDYVDARVGGKSILIVPAALAMVELKKQVDAGAVPGFTSANFFSDMFEDEEHLKQPAQYLVALTFYATLYRQTPENLVSFNGPLTAEQAKIFQKIAWTVVSTYAGSGIIQ